MQKKCKQEKRRSGAWVARREQHRLSGSKPIGVDRLGVFWKYDYDVYNEPSLKEYNEKC